MGREFREDLDKLPKVGMPDWDLLSRIEDLLNPYRPNDQRIFKAEDSRGSYDAETAEELRREVEAQEEPPQAFIVQMHDTGRVVALRISDIGSRGTVVSDDEAFVNHVSTRLRELFLRAYVAIAPPEAFEQGASFGRPEPERRPEPQVRYGSAEVEFKLDPQLSEPASTQPSFWAQHAATLVVTVVGTIIAGAILIWIFGNGSAS
jgi:hypothetical protein